MNSYFDFVRIYLKYKNIRNSGVFNYDEYEIEYSIGSIIRVTKLERNLYLGLQAFMYEDGFFYHKKYVETYVATKLGELL